MNEKIQLALHADYGNTKLPPDVMAEYEKTIKGKDIVEAHIILADILKKNAIKADSHLDAKNRACSSRNQLFQYTIIGTYFTWVDDNKIDYLYRLEDVDTSKHWNLRQEAGYESVEYYDEPDKYGRISLLS